MIVLIFFSFVTVAFAFVNTLEQQRCHPPPSKAGRYLHTTNYINRYSSTTLSSSSSSDVESSRSTTEEQSASKASKAKDVVSATKTAETTKIKSKRTRDNVVDDDDDDDDDNIIPPSTSTIKGLLPTKRFNLLCHIHCTLTLLRKHFPTLLELPSISSSTAKLVYDNNIMISGPKDEILAEGLDEVLLLNRALATAAVAAKRAGSLLDLAIGGTSSSPSQTDGVECELLIDPDNPLEVLVFWKTRLPSIISPTSPFGIQVKDEDKSTSYTEFRGISTLVLSPESGLVTNLQVNEVKINGVAIIESLGTALSTLRRTARSAMSTFDDSERKSSTGNPLFDGLLNGVRDVADALEAASSEEKENSLADSQLLVVPKHLWTSAAYPVEEGGIRVNSTSENEQNIFKAISIDEYTTRQVPLPCSESFVEYAAHHKSLQSFAESGIYQLAGIETSVLADISSESVRSLFATDAELVTRANDSEESITLLRGAGKISDLYRSLAIIRNASNGNFNIQIIEVDVETRRIAVRWNTLSPLKVEGTDAFLFQSETSNRLPLSDDGDKEKVASQCISYFNDQSDNIPSKISRVENLDLKVEGVIADSKWAKSFVSAALRSGITDNTPLPVTELLQALTKSTTTQKANTDTKQTKKKKIQMDIMPLLDDTAAVSFYNIIRSLHNDLPNIVNLDKSSSSIPAGDYLAESVELRGLLSEVLVRGDQSYRRLFSLAISSIRASLQSNNVRLAAQPKPTIEVTSKGTIRVTFVLALWVVGPQLPLGESNNQFGMPLKIEITSEYKVDDSGRIREQIILESRLNGVLTPGDALTKWIKGLGQVDDDDNNSMPSAVDSLIDTMKWVRSIQKGNK